MVNWQLYFDSIQESYQKWWQVDTIIRVKNDWFSNSSPLEDLQVETVPDETFLGKKDKQPQRLEILAGLRKYSLDSDDSDNHVLLQGKPGSGKSTALVRLLFEEAGKRDETRIPVFIKLRSHKTSTIALIHNFLKSHKIYLNDPEIDRLLFENQLFVMLDGVNELPSEEATKEVKVFRDAHPKVPMVFTTRDLGIWGNLGIETRLTMQPLTEGRMRSFVRGYLEDKGEKLLNQLNNERLKKLGETPLFLLMLCFVYDENEKIPDNLGETFRRFTRQHYKQSKADVTTLADSKLLWSESLEYLAFEMTKRKDKPAIGIREAKSIIREFLQENNENNYSTTRQCLWLSDLENHHLIQKLDEDSIEFHHQLIQEYYAAEYLLQQLQKLNDRDLQWRYLNYLKWTEPIALMLGLLKDKELALKVVRLALAVDFGLGARLAGEVDPLWQEETVQWVAELPVSPLYRLYLLGKTGSEKAHNILCKNLESSLDEKIAIVRALGNISSEKSRGTLIDLLKDQETRVCLESAAILEQISHSQDIPSLINIFKIANEAIKFKIIDIFEILNDPKLISALLDLIDGEKDGFLIQRIGYVIKNITNIDTLYKLKDYCDEQGLNFPSHYKPYLDKENHLYNIIPSFGKIRSYGPLVRAIPKLSKYESIEDIFVAINSSDEEIRQAAIQQSENFPLRDDILDLLLQALNDKDESVYLTTVNIFKKIATLETLSVLYQRIPKITSIYQLYDLIAIIASVQSKTKQYSLEPMENASEEQVFISYAWGEDSNEIADKLQTAFQNAGLTIIRDKTHLGYKGDIKKFMERIGQGNCVLIVISDKYLKSPNCMFELIEIAKNKDFYDRIFPVVLPDAKIYNPKDRAKYTQYWETQSKELEETMKQGGLANLQGITDDLNLYTEIRNQIAPLIDTLKNMNVLNLDFHRQEDFETIIQEVQKQLERTYSEKNSPLENSNPVAPLQVIQNFYGPVYGVAGNVQGNQINQREEKE
ncbi:MAG: TIR domain-containing protein [Microcystis aeruginosa Ma_QC_B_20070730_S2]|uniref:TIR domain-containing protein n=1 Tax=Microcystis aeruginosa Ma_QC_B_20070730_S2 TaxID=2486256 RepID=A0A552DGI4_MICAE|nr:MAG: TIR domain-containing protein [Microcystis aeruginosa Ma_QC_B_20070730_S2]